MKFGVRVKTLLWLLVYSINAIADNDGKTVHQSISDSIERTANYIDDFFANERLIVEGSTSRVIVSYASLYDRDAQAIQQYYFDARINLPKTEKKWRFLVLNEGEVETEKLDPPLPAPVVKAVDKGEPVAALQYIINESRLWHVSTRAGLSVAYPLDPLASLRVRRLIKLGIIDNRIVQEFQWSESNRFSETTTLDFERLVSENFFSRLSFVVGWGEKNDQLAYINDLAFYKKLKSNLLFKYDVGYQGDFFHGFRLRRVFVNLHYRQNFYKKWMFFEVAPEFFREETDWQKTRFQFLLKLDFVFGRMY